MSLDIGLKKIAVLTTLLGTAWILSSCAAGIGEKSRIDHATGLINRRAFGEAIATLEQDRRVYPGNPDFSILLAQAHLGAAGFELMRFLSGLSGPQNELESLGIPAMPDCSNEAARLAKLDFRCALARMIIQMPEVDNPHLDSARRLLRETYPDPRTAPQDMNFLAAFVELGSAASRLKPMLERTATAQAQSAMRSGDVASFPFRLYIHHLKRFFVELRQGFGRARHSYGKISRYVVGIEGAPLIRIGRHTLVFDDQLGMPTILNFWGAVLHERASGIDSELNHKASRGLSFLGPGLLRMLDSMDMARFNGEGSRTLAVSWQFTSVIGRLLSAMADRDEVGVNPLDLLWEHPPGLFGELSTAFQLAWEVETEEPILAYLDRTRTAWSELRSLMADWETWSNHMLRPEQREAMLAHLRSRGRVDPRLAPPPSRLTGQNVSLWANDFFEGMSHSLEHALADQEMLIRLKRDQIETAQGLVRRTRAWYTTHLWRH